MHLRRHVGRLAGRLQGRRNRELLHHGAWVGFTWRSERFQWRQVPMWLGESQGAFRYGLRWQCRYSVIWVSMRVPEWGRLLYPRQWTHVFAKQLLQGCWS